MLTEATRASKDASDQKEIIMNESNDQRQIAKMPDFIQRPAHSHIIPLGVGKDRQEISVPLKKIPHLLLVGKPSTGKSILINTVMYHLLTNTADWQVYGIDLRGDALTSFSRFDQVKMIATTLEESVMATEKVIVELYARYQLMAEIGACTIDDLKTPPPPIMFIVQESDAMFGAFQYDNLSNILLRNMIEEIVSLGRAAGIHLVLSTQEMNPFALTVRKSLNGIIIMGQTDTTTSNLLLNSSDASSVSVINGRGYLQMGVEGQEFQSYYTPLTWFEKIQPPQPQEVPFQGAGFPLF